MSLRELLGGDLPMVCDELGVDGARAREGASSARLR